MQSQFGISYGSLTVKNGVATQIVLLDFENGAHKHAIELSVQVPEQNSIAAVHQAAEAKAIELMKQAIAHMSLAKPML